jgi:hypothetical protein
MLREKKKVKSEQELGLLLYYAGNVERYNKIKIFITKNINFKKGINILFYP